MNINANEMLLINKNLKFKGEEPVPAQAGASVTEPPVTNPQTGLNALEMQGKNNIAFQGVVLKNVKNAGLKAMMALALLASAATTTSCGEDKEVIYMNPNGPTQVTTNITIDFAQQTALLQQMLALYQQMLDQQKITNEQFAETNAFLLQMMGMLTTIQSNQETSQEMMKSYYEQMYGFMLKNDANQQMIISLLQANGKTEEESRDFLEMIFAEVKSGNLSQAEAMQKIMEELGAIKGVLTEILAKLKNIATEITSFRDSYEAGKKENAENFGKLYNQGVMQEAYLKALGQGLSVMNDNIIGINRNVSEFKALVQKDFAKLMGQLKTMDKNSVDYKKFEEMFKLLNMNLTNVINKAANDITGALDEVNGNIANFEQTYIDVESAQTEQLIDIKNTLNLIAQFPGIDQSGVEEAIKGLTDAVNNNTSQTTQAIKDVEAALKRIMDQIDTLLMEVGSLSKKVDIYANLFSDQFDVALETLVNEFRNGVASVKTEQQISNQYLKSLNEQVAALKASIDKIDVVNGGMTVEEFEAVMKERDEANYNKYKALLESLGIKIDITNIKLDELKKAINDAIAEKAQYAEQLDRIIALLEGVNLKDYSDKFDEIAELLKNFKCNCSCSGNGGNNEGIIGDLDKIFG